MKKKTLIIGCVVFAAGCVNRLPSAQAPVTELSTVNSPAQLPTLPTDITTQSPPRLDYDSTDKENYNNFDRYQPIQKAKSTYKTQPILKAKPSTPPRLNYDETGDGLYENYDYQPTPKIKPKPQPIIKSKPAAIKKSIAPLPALPKFDEKNKTGTKRR